MLSNKIIRGPVDSTTCLRTRPPTLNGSILVGCVYLIQQIINNQLKMISYGFSCVLYFRNETTDLIFAGGLPKPTRTFLFVF